MRTCSVEGCERKYYAKGLCQYHYKKEYNSKPERKLQKKEYNSKPENKLRKKEWNKEYNSKPERKLKKKEWNKEYYSKPENKLKRKEYESKPENKLKRKEYESKPERKLKRKEYASKPENKLKAKEYNSKPENKLRVKEYNKQHPEIGLKSQQKRFKKLGEILGYPSKQIPMLYHSWAKTVKKILGNYCHICGSIKQIEVHHIFHKIKYPSLSLNENNGIPLCHLCHQQAHGKMLFV